MRDISETGMKLVPNVSSYFLRITNPDMENTLYDLLDSHRTKYLQLLQQEHANEVELASCQNAIQYYLAQIVSQRKAQRPQNSLGQFFRSIIVRFVPSSQPSVS
jgi:hypothetical protein